MYFMTRRDIHATVTLAAYIQYQLLSPMLGVLNRIDFNHSTPKMQKLWFSPENAGVEMAMIVLAGYWSLLWFPLRPQSEVQAVQSLRL